MGGLYLHIPFCDRKCIYCDFYSVATDHHSSDGQARIDEFVALLKNEIALSQHAGQSIPFTTVYLGGGTPSLLNPRAIEEILRTLGRTFTIHPDAEITLEANPGTVTLDKLRGFREAGVNRLSVGVQSFHDDELRFLSRIHTSREARQCIDDARRAGYTNFNLDLIFGLQGQTMERWNSSLTQAVELEPKHVSCYSLTVEPGTPLAGMVRSREVSLPGEPVDADMYMHAIRFLASHGYEQYEVSNFARPGHRSRHNLGYWDHSPYLGFGPSAHSFLDGKRWWNVSSIDAYRKIVGEGRAPIESSEVLGRDQLIQEEVFLGLRSRGVDLEGLAGRYGASIADQLRPQFEDLVARSMAQFESERLRLTDNGYLLCDEICSSLVFGGETVSCAS